MTDLAFNSLAPGNETMEAPVIGAITLKGAPGQLASMHPDSGWKLLDCLRNPDPQTLLAYCDPESPRCQDVFINGAKNTVIKIPDGCGSSLIAKVVSLEKQYMNSR